VLKLVNTLSGNFVFSGWIAGGENGCGSHRYFNSVFMLDRPDGAPWSLYACVDAARKMGAVSSSAARIVMVCGTPDIGNEGRKLMRAACRSSRHRSEIQRQD
jgi:hypothetical protein